MCECVPVPTSPTSIGFECGTEPTDSQKQATTQLVHFETIQQASQCFETKCFTTTCTPYKPAAMIKRRNSFTTTAYSRAQQELILSKLYLNEAKYNFQTSDYHNEWIRVGMTSVQGWRVTQEDAHICMPDFGTDKSGKKVALFAVFDGHNGRDVAEYAADMIPKYVQQFVADRDEYGKCNRITRLNLALKYSYL